MLHCPHSHPWNSNLKNGISFFSTIEDTPFEDEDGDLRDREDFAFRQEAINEKNHVTWNAERRCFISAEAAERWIILNISLCTPLKLPLFARSLVLVHSFARTPYPNNFTQSITSKDQIEQLRWTVALVFFFFQFAEQDRSESFLACRDYEDTSSTGHQGEGKTGFIRGRYPDFIPRSGVCQYGALALPWSKKVCFCFYLKVKSICKFCQKLLQIKPATLCWLLVADEFVKSLTTFEMIFLNSLIISSSSFNTVYHISKHLDWSSSTILRCASYFRLVVLKCGKTRFWYIA